MNPVRPTVTVTIAKKSLPSLRQGELVGNHGPSPDVKIERSIVTIEEVGSTGTETYQLACVRKVRSDPRTTYGGKMVKYTDSRKQAVKANLQDLVFEDADKKITYEKPSYADGSGSGVVAEAHESSSSEVKSGRSSSGTSSSQCQGKRKSIDEFAGGMGGFKMSNSQHADAKPARTKKLYELDPVQYPYAAGARASHENRIRLKREREQMIADLAFYKARYERLQIENEALKEELYELRNNTIASEWAKFFQNAGIVQGDGMDIEYANLFEQQRMRPSMLGDIDENLLRSFGITAFGDIHLIVKHAKNVFEHTKGLSLFMEQSVPRPP